jgi:hypothetical protein
MPKTTAVKQQDIGIASVEGVAEHGHVALARFDSGRDHHVILNRGVVLCDSRSGRTCLFGRWAWCMSRNLPVKRCRRWHLLQHP